MWQNVNSWMVLVKDRWLLIILFLQRFCRFDIFQTKQLRGNKNVPIVNVMGSPTLNDLYKQGCHHFWLKQNPTQNYLAPNQEL